MSDVESRFGLLDELRTLAKKGASVEASLITTFTESAARIWDTADHSWHLAIYDKRYLRTCQAAANDLHLPKHSSARTER